MHAGVRPNIGWQKLCDASSSERMATQLGAAGNRRRSRRRSPIGGERPWKGDIGSFFSSRAPALETVEISQHAAIWVHARDRLRGQRTRTTFKSVVKSRQLCGQWTARRGQAIGPEAEKSSDMLLHFDRPQMGNSKDDFATY